MQISSVVPALVLIRAIFCRPDDGCTLSFGAPVRGSEFIAYPLNAGSDGAIAWLCEALPGCDPPCHSRRRRWRAEIEESLAGADAMLLFTDTAHSTLIWSARSAGHPEWGVQEYRLPRDLAALVDERAAGGSTATNPRSMAAEAEYRPILEQLLTPVARDDRPPPYRESIVDWLEEIEIDTVRSFWRSLVDFAVLDPACGAGQWLLSVGHLLEPIHLVLLSRIQGAIDDEQARRTRRRPEHLSDFRRISEREGLSDGVATRAGVARRLILKHNLHGIAGSAQEVRACRTALLRFAAAGAGPVTSLDLHAHRWRASSTLPGLRRRPAPCGDPRTARTAPAEELVEEARLLGHAHALIECMRSESTPPELRRAARDLERRTARLITSSEASFTDPVAAARLVFPSRAARGFRYVRELA